VVCGAQDPASVVRSLRDVLVGADAS